MLGRALERWVGLIGLYPLEGMTSGFRLREYGFCPPGAEGANASFSCRETALEIMVWEKGHLEVHMFLGPDHLLHNPKEVEAYYWWVCTDDEMLARVNDCFVRAFGAESDPYKRFEANFKRAWPWPFPD